MINLLKQACLHPIDYVGVLKTRTLIFKEKLARENGIYTFVFEIAKPFNWKAGQHAIFTLPGKNVQGKTWRPFSIASSAHEQLVMIGTNIPDTPSDFKKKLMVLVPGEEISIHGPFGEFHTADKPRQIVGVAGGIGITPFRALAYEIARGYLPDTKLTLVYSAKDSYTFKDELDSWQNENLEIIYTHTPNEVNSAIHNQFNIYSNEADYYISGSPGMIGAIRKNLQKLGIKKIVNDPFRGY